MMTNQIELPVIALWMVSTAGNGWPASTDQHGTEGKASLREIRSCTEPDIHGGTSVVRPVRLPVRDNPPALPARTLKALPFPA